MDSNRAGSTPAPDDPKLIAKVRGLERMWVAGLIDEPTYRAKLAELQGQLDGAGRGASAPVAPARGRHGDAPPLPPRPEAPAPPPLVVSTPAPPLPPRPAAEFAPATTDGEIPAVDAEAAPGEPDTSGAPRRTGPPGVRGVVVASAVTVGVLAVAVAAVLVLRAHSSSAVPPPGQTPDAIVALLAQRLAAPPLPDAVIDTVHAERLVRAYWPVREKVLAEHDSLAVRELETGAAAQWDAVGCGPACARPSPRSLHALNLFVPRQPSYPAAFLAEVLTTEYQHGDTPMLELMVFSRSSAGSPWSLALDTGYTGSGSLREFPVSIDGGAFDDSAPAVAGVDQRALPATLAAYLQHWVNTGTAPAGSALRDGSFTSTPGAALHEQVIEDRGRGSVDTVSFRPGGAADGVWTFAVKQRDIGGESGTLALTCGVVRYTTVSDPVRRGGELVQDQGFSPFGTLLAPGSYRQVTETGLHQSCFLSGPGLAGVTVLGNNGSAVRATGVRS